MNLQADNNNGDDKILGWKQLLTRVAVATFIYSIIAYNFAGTTPATGLKTAFGRLFSITLVNACLFIIAYTVISIITVILFKLFRTKLHITNILGKALIPGIVVGGIMIMGGRYNTLHPIKASEMKPSKSVISESTRKDLYDGFKRACIKAQQANPINKSVQNWQIEEYCECSSRAISQQITLEEIDYFQSKNVWPAGFEERTREEGFKCIDKLTKKGTAK